MTKAVLWDIDGTVLNFLAAESAAVKKLFLKYGLGECTDEMIGVYSKINVRYWEYLERNEMTKSQILVGRFAEFFETIGIDPAIAPAFNDEYQIRLGDTIVFYEGAYETLKALKGNVVQIAVTNGTKTAQTRKLGESGLIDIFDAVFISEDVGIEKPNRGYFEAIFKAFPNINPSEMLIVGDSLTSDVQGGNNVGIPTCWFNPYGKEKDREVKVDYEIRRIPEVLGILRVNA